MAQIRQYDQMVRESEIAIERFKEKMAEEREQRRIDNERLQRESEASIAKLAAERAKLEAERAKLDKDTRFYPLIALVIASIAAIGSILAVILPIALK